MSTELIKVTINGRDFQVAKGARLIDVCRENQFDIPSFCYYADLALQASCRMCLVRIEKMPKLQTSCTITCTDGMVVTTQSEEIEKAQRSMLEFQLANHPLDCPVCDRGGECPLQDFTFRHGYPTSRIDGPRLHFKKPIPLSNQIALDRERCVLCYRCTRYYDEIAWEQELTTEQRGVQSFITSQFDRPLKSIFSGNIIDLCPVGALTSRVWRFEARPWDMTHREAMCPMRSVAGNVSYCAPCRPLHPLTS